MFGKNGEVMIDMLNGSIGTWRGYKDTKEIKDTDRYLVEFKPANSLLKAILPYSVKKSSVITIDMTGEFPGQFSRYHFVFPDENRDDINYHDSLLKALNVHIKIKVSELEKKCAKLEEENFLLVDKINTLKSSKFSRSVGSKFCDECNTESTMAELHETGGKCPICGTQILKGKK